MLFAKSYRVGRLAGARLARSCCPVHAAAGNGVLFDAAGAAPIFAASVICQPKAYFSDSHDDFAPKRKSVSGEDEALKMIQGHVDNNKIMLYMKGNPQMPMCGFSAKVVQVLKKEEVDFSSVNILDYPAIREGVKKFSEWPTIPQLYVNGEFIGGCDIVESMHESGELKELLDEAK